MVKIGDKLPNAQFGLMTDDGPVSVPFADKLAGRKVVVFGFPGAFTPTCSSLHMPSITKNKTQYDAKGVDEVICIAVNDPHVMRVWGEVSGATAVGITVLADMDGAYTKAIGLDFTVPSVGFFGRSQRYSMYIVDGVVLQFNLEESRSNCVISGGDALLRQI